MRVFSLLGQTVVAFPAAARVKHAPRTLSFNPPLYPPDLSSTQVQQFRGLRAVHFCT